jgi:hypothetical protein
LDFEVELRLFSTPTSAVGTFSAAALLVAACFWIVSLNSTAQFDDDDSVCVDSVSLVKLWLSTLLMTTLSSPLAYTICDAGDVLALCSSTSMLCSAVASM